VNLQALGRPGDRRAYPRVTCTLTCAVAGLGEGRVLNVSDGGAFVALPDTQVHPPRRAPPPRHRRDPPLELPAEVVRVTTLAPHGIGLAPSGKASATPPSSRSTASCSPACSPRSPRSWRATRAPSTPATSSCHSGVERRRPPPPRDDRRRGPRPRHPVPARRRRARRHPAGRRRPRHEPSSSPRPQRAAPSPATTSTSPSPAAPSTPTPTPRSSAASGDRVSLEVPATLTDLRAAPRPRRAPTAEEMFVAIPLPYPPGKQAALRGPRHLEHRPRLQGPARRGLLPARHPPARGRHRRRRRRRRAPQVRAGHAHHPRHRRGRRRRLPARRHRLRHHRRGLRQGRPPARRRREALGQLRREDGPADRPPGPAPRPHHPGRHRHLRRRGRAHAQQAPRGRRRPPQHHPARRQAPARPVIIIPPAHGKRKESTSVLAQILVESFAKARRDVVVLRFDGVRNIGESYKDPDCREPGPRGHAHQPLAGRRRHPHRLDYVYNNPNFTPDRGRPVLLQPAGRPGRRAAFRTRAAHPLPHRRQRGRRRPGDDPQRRRRRRLHRPARQRQATSASPRSSASTSTATPTPTT
jgi:hypothetical protein